MSDKIKLGIIDYGMGNLFNLSKVVTYLGVDPIFCVEPEELKTIDKAILPGVGAFGDGIGHLKLKGMDKAIRQFVETGKPLLGICLGMQLLMNESEEGGINQGLGIIPGRVIRFNNPTSGEIGYKIPHIGWNSVNMPLERNTWTETIFAGIHPKDYVYFVHSYTVCPNEKNVVLSETHYGSQNFCSALVKNNVSGCQFHPEVSGRVGLNILKSFLSH